MSSPLYNALIKHEKLNRASFHTPGHKSSGIINPNLLNLDFTELPDTDALFEANGVILECEKNLARLFGATRTLISAGGCSLAIMTMIRLATKNGGKLLCGRNIHRSAVNAMTLLGIEPIWISPINNGFFTGRIDAGEVRKALSENSDICGCYITSPTYYGEISDIHAISEVCREYDIPLLVDNAHGSHLKFLSRNIHPITLGASMTACSVHKTLPVLTGGALLNISDSRFIEGAKEAMSLFASTSPSYPIMASIDLCSDYISKNPDIYKRLEPIISDIKSTADSIGIIQPKEICDPLRLALNTSSIGISGESAGEFFRSMGVEPEFADKENVVFICTPFNSKEDFSRLKNSILALPSLEKDFIAEEKRKTSLPKRVMSLREAVLGKSEFVPKERAVGRISADTACPCPPGIPVYMPGELIEEFEGLNDVVKVLI
mgnify:CR=1 FL=1